MEFIVNHMVLFLLAASALISATITWCTKKEKIDDSHILIAHPKMRYYPASWDKDFTLVDFEDE